MLISVFLWTLLFYMATVCNHKFNIWNTVLICLNCHAMLQAAMTIGNTTNAPITGQTFQSPHVISTPSVSTSAATPTMPALQIPTVSVATPLIPHHVAPEFSSNSNHATNLVKPSSFFVPPPPSSTPIVPPSSASTPSAPPLHPAVSVQRPFGAPLLQPFPPPNPPPSLAPASVPPSNYGPVITREKVRDALLVLVQVSLLAWYQCLIFCLK